MRSIEKRAAAPPALVTRSGKITPSKGGSSNNNVEERGTSQNWQISSMKEKVSKNRLGFASGGNKDKDDLTSLEKGKTYDFGKD